jgi:hypothetical protein
MYFNAALIKKSKLFANQNTLLRTVESMPYLAFFFLEIIQIMVVMTDMFLLFEGDPKDYNATIGFKSK